MWFIMAGNTGCSVRPLAIGSPLLMLSMMASIPFATTMLPQASRVISSDSRTGTPALSRAEKVDANRDRAVFLASWPKTGAFNFVVSHSTRPLGVLMK